MRNFMDPTMMRSPPLGTTPMKVPTTRPAIIIQAPSRDKQKQNSQNPPSQQNSQNSPYSQYNNAAPASIPTLYVNLQRCPHSNDLLFSVTHMLKIQVNVVDVSREAPPPWLPGTPTFVHDRSVYCGDNAFQFAESYASTVNESQQKSVIEVIAEGGTPAARKSVGGKGGRGKGGTSLSNAFKPVTVEDDGEIEAKYAETTDAKLQRMMAGR